MVLMGNYGVGKTCLYNALNDQNFQSLPTNIGIEFKDKTVPFRQNTLKIQIVSLFCN